jgi:ANTAR domain
MPPAGWSPSGTWWRVAPPAVTRAWIGQALADVATISLLNERSLRRSVTLNEQLQSALNSRVTIEQAKGKLAERLQVDIPLLRNYARSRNRRLSEMAREFVDGSERLADLSAAPPSPRRAPRPGPPR